MGGGAERHIGGVHQLFEARARERPEHVAVVTEAGRVTYGQLDRRANRLARHLANGRLRHGETVAVCTDRLPDVLVAILATLKAGGAYAVLGKPGSSRETTELLERSGAVAIVTHERHRPRIADGGRAVVRMDTDDTAIAAHPAEPLEAPGPPAAAAVLITAGGERRAVPVGHARLAAAFAAWTTVYELTGEDRYLLTAPPDTAAFTGGWIRALCSGAVLELPVRAAGERPVRQGVTVLDTSPDLAARRLRHEPPTTLRLVVVGGERLRLDEQARLHRRLAPGARLVNAYGPAETAGCGTWFEQHQLAGPVAEPHRVALLGRPMPGCRVELRRGQLWLTPPDGGDALPTGDLARQRDADGLLEFRGRQADRVRAHGRSVDPYEAEAALAAHPGVSEAVIGAAGGRLIAYVVPRGSVAPDMATLRRHLTGTVPKADIPDAVITLAALPRDAAGKLDRRALPLPPRLTAGAGGKGAARPAAGGGRGGSSLGLAGYLVVAPILAMLAALLTDPLWPGSTDLSLVPDPYAWYFRGLYVAEWLAAGVGAVFLLEGPSRMLRQGKPRALTIGAYLSVAYLLVSWWPQDNFYRLAEKYDYPRQAALVYAFNIPLMITAGIVALWASWPAWAPGKRRLDD